MPFSHLVVFTKSFLTEQATPVSVPISDVSGLVSNMRLRIMILTPTTLEANCHGMSQQTSAPSHFTQFIFQKDHSA